MTDRILIVDGLVSNRIILKVRIGAAGQAVLQAATGAEALELAASAQPGLILLAADLPDMPGVAVCRRLRADPRTEHLPIILVGAAADPAARRDGLAAGADEVLARPLDEAALGARIRCLLRARQAELDLERRAGTCRELGLAEAGPSFERPPRVALVARDAAAALGWRAVLAPHLAAVWQPLAAADALAAAGQPGAPDLFLVGADLAAAGDGLRLVAELRARLGAAGSAICLARDRPWDAEAALGLDLGADAIAPLPLDGAETALRLRRLLDRRRRAEALRRTLQAGLQLAATDPLTGLWNRRYALAHLDRVAARALGGGGDFAVVVLDLDRFKTINDRHGHAAGDLVLQTVAARLKRALRPSDLLARIGGEEFLAVLTDIGEAGAQATAERLCRAVAAEPVPLPPPAEAVTVTVSAGLALALAPGSGAGRGPGESGGPAEDSAAALASRTLARADAALFASKSDGRNKVRVASAA
jgi:two-component system cell cycle response regulator